MYTLTPSLIEYVVGFYILYLFAYLKIVSKWYVWAGIPADEIPGAVLAFIFVMGGPAIWVAYPLARRSKQ